jgi:prepilin-type N-terminal cleavage/methylation domain-containing protein
MRSSQSKLNADERLRGFTLLELMLVATLIVVIAAISIPNFIQVWQNAQLRAAAAEVADLTQQARMSATNRISTFLNR